MTCYSGVPCVRRSLVCREKAKPGIYYHYTSLETLWAILDSETLRATQACFSNDSEEVKKGKDLIAKICEKNYQQDRCAENKELMEYSHELIRGENDDIDCYIVCFCGDDDKLSQWRAYCRNDGVSIGFAFDGTEPHYYFKDMPIANQSERNLTIYPVWYLDGNNKANKNQHYNVDSEQEISNKILENLKELRRLADFQMEKASLESTIPLIKHAGFYEEEEYRLLICNTQSEQGGSIPFPLDPYVQMRSEGGLQNPYINISFGKNYPEVKNTNEGKKPDGGKKIDSDSAVKRIRLYNIPEELTKLIANRFAGIDIHEEVIQGDNRSQIVIGPGEEKNQQTVFESVERTVAEVCIDTKEEIKIWCEGHLPIRSIRVSPCINQKQVIKSIKHYCKHKKYWLKYVDVVGSEIPYRRPK